MTTDHTALAQAEQAALAQNDTQAVEATAAACPLSAQTVNKVLEIRVVGEDGEGIDGVEVRVTRDDGQALLGKTNPDGGYRFKGLPPGAYQLSLPRLDEEAWQVKTTLDLAEPDANCSVTAAWQSAPEAPPDSQQVHVIKQGECIGKIAEHYGFFPATLWNHGTNAALKELRHGNMYILLENDKVVIPEKRQKSEVAEAGKQITIERRGVPESLNIRFLDYDESPKAHIPYLLSLKTLQGAPVGEISGQTDENGFVSQAVPPSATQATVVLNPGTQAETHLFNIGHANPIDTTSGWQARLKALGYHYAEDDDEPGERSEMAIREFQRFKQLEETGEMDEATRSALSSSTLS